MLDMNALRDWRFSIDMQGIAWAVFDREGESQNSLGPAAAGRAGHDRRARRTGRARQIDPRARLHLRQGEGLHRRRRRARVREARRRAPGDRQHHAQVNGYLDRIERLPIPVVCCIHGFCLGGGLELALACHWRIATRDDATRIGFPEVKLGIFPGFNGTARSIRQAGALSAMPLMLTGSMMRASAARGMGLIDELVPSPLNLRWAARKAIERKRKSKPAGGWRALDADVAGARAAGREVPLARRPRRCARSTIPRRSG